MSKKYSYHSLKTYCYKIINKYYALLLHFFNKDINKNPIHHYPRVIYNINQKKCEHLYKKIYQNNISRSTYCENNSLFLFVYDVVIYECIECGNLIIIIKDRYLR